MPAIRTVHMLAGSYRGRSAPDRKVTRTHAWRSGDDRTLCGIAAARTTEHDPLPNGEEHRPPTCPTCARRDPRAKSGGPFLLASLLSF